MKAINASKMYCTVTMQVTYQVSWCYFKWCNSRKCSRYLTSTQFVSQGHCGSVFWTVNKTRKHKKIQYYITIINNNYQQEKTMGRETKQVNWSIGLSILFFISPFFTGTTDPSGTALILSGNFPPWAFKIYSHPWTKQLKWLGINSSQYDFLQILSCKLVISKLDLKTLLRTSIITVTMY